MVWVCVWGGRVAKFPSLRQIGYNSVGHKKEENGGYLRNLQQITTVLKLHCMDMYASLISDRYIL